MTKWSTQHYNALAKEIREVFPPYDPGHEQGWDNNIKRRNIEQRAILTTLALNLATRFAEDNKRFDPKKFLDACSPDITQFPLSELWGDDRPKNFCKECDGEIYGTNYDVHESCRRYPD